MRARKPSDRRWIFAFFLAATAALPSTGAASPSLDSALLEWLSARAAHSSLSPEASELSPALRRENGADYVDLLVRGDVSNADIARLGGEVRTVAGPIRTVHLPVSAIESFVALSGLEQAQTAQGLTLQSNVSIPEIGANAMWGGTPPNYPSPPTGNTGRGVVVGLIDSGVDVNHADFRTSANKTRFLWVWDQSFGQTKPPPSGYTYGGEYSASMIDGGQYLGLDDLGHGTHVLSIAAGNGRATGNGQPAYQYIGAAPEADLIAVKVVALANGSYSDANVLDAARYIFQKAGTKPTVILIAMGKNTGPHDGQDPLDLGLSALTGAGKLIVTGAGNYGGKSVHGEWISSASNQTGNITINFGAYGPAPNAADNFRTEAWYDAGVSYDVSVVTPSGQVIGPIVRGANTEVQTPSGIVRIKNGQTTSANGSYMVDLYVYRGSLSLPLVATGTWTYRFKSNTSGAHRVDAWLTTYSLGSTLPVFVSGMTETRLITSPASGTNVLSAGAYSTKRSWTALNGHSYVIADAVVGDMALLSGPGPRRDGVQAPTVAAPGYGVVGAKSTAYYPASSYIMADGQHVIDVGTSVAAAHLAGTMALMLGLNPGLTTAQARLNLQTDAHLDAYTGVVPNSKWGYGKLRAQPSAVAVDPAAARFGFAPLSSNPVRGTVRFRLALADADLADAVSSLRLRIFDVRGRELASLHPTPAPGAQTIAWNGLTTAGFRVPSGVYTARLDVGPRHAQYRFVRID